MDKIINFNGVSMDISSNVNTNGYWWRNFIAKNILAKKYYHDNELEQFNKGNEDEAFKMFVERVSGIFSTKELQLFMAKSLYTGNYILAGRSLYGAGAKGKFNSSMSNCFTAGHKVITKRGLVNIEDVVKGDIVLTHTGDWQLVNAVMERDYEGDLIKFKVQNGYDDITCTPNHKFLTNKDWERADRLLASNDKRVKNCSKITMPVELQYQKNYDNVDLKNVFDNEEYKIIEEDDKLRYQKNIDGNWRTYGNPINRYLKLDDDMMYFIGRWLGDGSITIREKQPYHSILRIVFNATTEQEAFERCKEIGVKHFGIEPSVRFTEQNVISMTFENPIIGEWFYQEFGKRCDGKYVPDKYLGDFNMAIGLLDSDGIILSHGAVSITLKNKRLIDWLRDTLYLNGVNTQNPYPTKHINTWSMLIATSIAKARLVPYMAKTYYDLRQGKVSITDTSYYTKVMDVEILENRQCKVYNLSVENDNSYTVNGIVCHNCYILDKPNDNIESIFDVAKRMARIFSFGGGCGIDISNLRPANAKVNNVARTSTGAVSFMNLYSAVGETIAQNSRRGALLIALDCTHPDIEDFLTIKQNNDKVQGANISIKFTDEFMNAVKDNQDVELYFKVNATGEEITKTINAKEFFMKFCEAQYDYAEPGAIFIDSVRNWNLLSEYEDYKINVSNPCVTGDTLILTDKGNIPIKDLVDKEVNVWNGYEWSKVIPKVTGHNQPIIRIAFSNGSYVDCTPYHKFVLKDGTRVEAKNLQISDKLATYTYYNKLYEEVEVTSIKNKDMTDTVYCMNEPINHTFIANGVITGNCSEFFGNDFNSCLTADTKIVTNDGVRMIGDMVGTQGYVLSNGTYEKYHSIVSKGIKPVYKLTLNNGLSIKATDNHKFYSDGQWVELKDLKEGDNLRLVTNSYTKPIRDYDNQYMMYGWLHGDGWFSTTIGISFNEKDGDYDAMKVLMPLFRKEFYAENIKATMPTDKATGKRKVSVQLQVTSQKAMQHALDLGFVPCKHRDKEFPTTFWNWTLKQQISFVRGLMSADGFILKNSSLSDDDEAQYRQIAFASNSEKMVTQLQEFLASLGIYSRKYCTVFTTEKRNPQYKLVMSREHAVRYYNIFGFCCERKNNKFCQGYGENRRFKEHQEEQVKSIEYVGEQEVFDIMEVNNTNAFYANGIYVHNCNLSSVNLYNFVSKPFTDKAEFNYIKFKQCLYNAVYIANEVLDYGYDTQPLDENRTCIDDWRSIGIGIFGLADMFVALGIKYGSQKSKDVLDEIMQTMQNATLWASSKYAKEHKPFGKYDRQKTLNCPLLRNIDNELHKHIDKYGLANGTLLSIAPTGSIAMLFRESGGVEPYYKVSYERTTHQLEKENKKFAISMLAVEDMLKYHKHTDYSEEHIKEAFPFVVDTYDIKPKDRIDIQSIMQNYVDNAISSTINLKEEATVQDIYDLYMYAWKRGCKGITIFRDNCKRISILGKDHGETRDGKADTVISEDGNKSDVVVAENAITETNITNPAKLNSITPIKRGNVKSLWGRTFLYHTACVPKFYVTVNIKDNEIFEVFVGADKGCQANISTITRMTSLALRSGVTVDEIIKNLNSAVCPACTNARYKGDKTIAKSCASCIASAIVEMQKTLNDGKNDIDTAKDIQTVQVSKPKMLTMNIKPMMKCPECGEPTLIPDGKCAYCSNCGYSKCD